MCTVFVHVNIFLVQQHAVKHILHADILLCIYQCKRECISVCGMFCLHASLHVCVLFLLPPPGVVLG